MSQVPDSQSDLVADAIRGLLNREPTPGEADAWVTAFNGRVDLTLLLTSLKTTNEYLHVIGANLRHSLQCLPHKSLAFVHIPKTAGSSIRSMFEKLTQYPMALIHEGPRNDSSFLVEQGAGTPDITWPFQAGHFPQAEFPSESVKFTFVREPISRLLSMYAFLRKISIDTGVEQVPDFETWTKSLPVFGPACSLFTAPQAFFIQNRFKSLNDYLKLSLDEQIELAVESAMSLGYIGWSQYEEDLVNGIEFATGTRPNISSRVNIGESSVTTFISVRSRADLERHTRLDSLVLESLMESGKLRRVASKELELYQQNVLSRLFFVEN